jgi:hypothetical protein
MGRSGCGTRPNPATMVASFGHQDGRVAAVAVTEDGRIAVANGGALTVFEMTSALFDGGTGTYSRVIDISGSGFIQALCREL